MYNYTQKQKEISASISSLRFPLTVMIVLYHCYCVQLPSNQPLYAACIYPFGLTLGETGVPAFFFISGYLFFFSQRSYFQKLRTRVSTLFVPYMIWNGLILLAFISLMLLGHPMEIANKNISDFQFQDYIRAFIDRGDWNRGNGQPMLCPYWYIRNLMVLSLAAPIIQYLIKGIKGFVVLIILLAWWISLPYNGMIAQSLAFFCMGAFFSINNVSPLIPDTGLKRTIVISLWAILLVCDWLIHFIIPIDGGLYVHRLVLILNIFVFMHIGSYLSKHFSAPSILEKSSFWIYTTHFPLITMIHPIIPIVGDWGQLAFYWVSVCFVVTCCSTSFAIGKRIMPNVINILTGNR